MFTRILIGLLIIAPNAYSENASYDPGSKIVKIPIVDINGVPSFENVELELRQDGLLELKSLSAIEEITSSGSTGIDEVENNSTSDTATLFNDSVIGSLNSSNDVDWFVYPASELSNDYLEVTLDISSIDSGSWRVTAYKSNMAIHADIGVGALFSTQTGTLEVVFPGTENIYFKVNVDNPNFYSNSQYKLSVQHKQYQ